MMLEDDGKEKAVRMYRMLAILLGLLGAGLLACGIYAVINEEVFGMPYFLGGFIVGIIALLSVGACSVVVVKAQQPVNGDTKMLIGYAVRAHYVLSMCMIVGSCMGTVLAGIGGFGDSYDASNNRTPITTLAVVILVGCIIAAFIAIYSLCVVCQYGPYFGVVVQRGRQGRKMIWNTAGSMAPPVFQTTSFQTNTNNQQVGHLEQQNRLLQQQLELQRQFNQQQQQQQTQFPDGLYPPPPPSYTFSESAHSSVQPPNYYTIT